MTTANDVGRQRFCGGFLCLRAGDGAESRFFGGCCADVVANCWETSASAVSTTSRLIVTNRPKDCNSRQATRIDSRSI